MCLAIPGKLVSKEGHNGIRMGRVQFGGITRETCLDFVPEASVGDYVIVHVGFAISRVDREEAERSYAVSKQWAFSKANSIPISKSPSGEAASRSMQGSAK